MNHQFTEEEERVLGELVRDITSVEFMAKSEVRARLKDFVAAHDQRLLAQIREEVENLADVSTNLIDMEVGPVRAVYERDVLALLT